MTLFSPNAGRVDPGSEAAAAAAVIEAAVTVTVFWMMTFPPVKDVEACTLNLVTGLPPSSKGWCQDTRAWLLAGVA